MNLRITKTQLFEIKHYFIIYLLLIINQSNLYTYFISTNLLIALELVLAFLMILHYKTEYNYCFAFLAFLLLSVIYVRYTVGGIGKVVWVEWTGKILIAFYAVMYDKDNFISRFVKLVVFFSAISLVFWIIELVDFNLIKSILFVHYNTIFHSTTWYSANYYVTTYKEAYGIFFYTIRDIGDMRNVGIFTEPGVYQMVLNVALYFTLFFRDKIYVNNKKIIRYIIILIVTLITTQSTTGYIGLVSIIICSLFSRKRKSSTIKFAFLTMILIGTLYLFIDYYMRGVSSFLYTTVISKFFSSSGSLDLNESTGKYRIGTILLAINTMVNKPLGVGYDTWNQLISADAGAGAGAAIFQVGVAIGLIPFIVILFWIFNSIFRSSKSFVAKFLFVFLYFNTVLAQSSPFYPALLIVPVSLLEIRRRKKKKLTCNV